MLINTKPLKSDYITPSGKNWGIICKDPMLIEHCNIFTNYTYPGEFIVDRARPITAILSLDINSTVKQLPTMDATAPWPFVSAELSQCRIFLLKSPLSDIILRNWQEDYPNSVNGSPRRRFLISPR